MSSLVELIFTAVGTEATAGAVGKVNNALGDTVRELGRLAVAGLTVQNAIGGVKGALQEGDTFTNLSLRVGESVRELVVLDTAFKNASLGTETIAQSANLLQRALGGVNEMGGRTDVAFKRIGTSIEELRRLTFTDQLAVMARGFASLETQSDRTAVAMQIFGRSGGQMLQLLGDPHALRQAQEQAARLGDRLERTSKAFDAVGDRLNVVNTRLREMWVAAAEQGLPTLNSVASLFERANLSGLGAFLGGATPGLLMGGAILKGFDLSDRALYSFLSRMQEGTARSLVRGLSNAMGEAVQFGGPLAIGGLIAEQVVMGLIAASEDSRVQALFVHEKSVAKVVAPAQEAALGIRSQEDEAKRLAAAAASIADLETRMADVAKKYAAAREEFFADPTSSRKGKLVDDYKEQLKVMGEQLTHMRALAAPRDAAVVAATIATNQLEIIKRELAPLVADLDKLEKKNAELRMKEMTPIERAGALQTERASLERQLQNVPAGLNADEIKARRLDLEDKLLKVQIQQRETAEQISTELKRHADERTKQELFALTTQMKEASLAGDTAREEALKREIAAKQAIAGLSGKDLELAQQRLAVEEKIAERDAAQAAARRQIEAAKLGLENSLNGIRENIARLEGDFGRTETDKYAERARLVAKQVTELEKLVKLEQERAAAARAPGGAGEKVALEHEQAATQFGSQLAGARGEQARLGADPRSLAQQMRSTITSLQNQLGTMAQNIASTFGGVITTGMGAASAGLQKLIGDTDYWSQRLGNVAGPVMGAVTKGITDMFTTWIVQRGLAAVKNMMFSAQEGTADAAAKTPGALLTSISSFGVAAAVGVAALLAAMAAFADGGAVRGPGTATSDSIPAWLSDGEFVNRAAAVDRFGVPFFEQLNAGVLDLSALPADALPGYSLGGFIKKTTGWDSLGQWLGSGLLPKGGLPKFVTNFQRDWNLLDGKKLTGARAAGQYEYTFDAPASGYDYYAGAAAAGGASSPAGVSGGGGTGTAGRRDGAPRIYMLIDRREFARAMQEDSTAYFEDLTQRTLRKHA